MNRSFIPFAFDIRKANTHQKKVPYPLTVNAIRDFTNESSDQFLRVAGFETVKHAGFGDGHL